MKPVGSFNGRQEKAYGLVFKGVNHLTVCGKRKRFPIADPVAGGAQI